MLTGDSRPADASGRGAAKNRNLAVLGAGLMGHAIAYLFAKAGFRVRVFDTSAASLESLRERVGVLCSRCGVDRALLSLISAHDDLSAAVDGAVLVIEAVAEDPILKASLFQTLDRITPADTILASNTSSIPIARLVQHVKNRHRVVGAHFWNPPHLVRLVEVVRAPDSDLASVLETVDILKSVGQHPVVINGDIAGLIGNRLQHALKREAIALVASGICDAETIDDVCKFGFGARLAVLGPLEQSDLVGLQLTKQIHDQLMPTLDVTPTTHPYLNKLVAAGELGMKTGKGFRTWTPESAEAVRERLANFLSTAHQ
jgi:3-hydroxybutyryl-CoA dehydrogenase